MTRLASTNKSGFELVDFNAQTRSSAELITGRLQADSHSQKAFTSELWGDFSPQLWGDKDVEQLTGLLQQNAESAKIDKVDVDYLKNLIHRMDSYVDKNKHVSKGDEKHQNVPDPSIKHLDPGKALLCIEQGLRLILHVAGSSLATPPKPLIILFDDLLTKASNEKYSKNNDVASRLGLVSIQKHSKDSLNTWDRLINWLRGVIFRCKDLRKTRMQMMQDAINGEDTRDGAQAISTQSGSSQASKQEHPVPAIGASSTKTCPVEVELALETMEHAGDTKDQGCRIF